MTKYIVVLKTKDNKLAYVKHTSGCIYHTYITDDKQLAKLFTRKKDAKHRAFYLTTGVSWHCKIHALASWVEEIVLEKE